MLDYDPLTREGEDAFSFTLCTKQTGTYLVRHTSQRRAVLVEVWDVDPRTLQRASDHKRLLREAACHAWALGVKRVTIKREYLSPYTYWPVLYVKGRDLCNLETSLQLAEDYYA